MSLINQMLQDLEARGKQGQTVAPMPTEVRPVLPPPRTSQMWMVVLGLALLLLVLVIWMVPRQSRSPVSHSALSEPQIAVAPAVAGGASTPVRPSNTGQAVLVPAAPATPAIAPPGSAVALQANSSSDATASTSAAVSISPSLSSDAAGRKGNGKASDRTPLNLKLIPELTSLTRLENARIADKPKPGSVSATEPAFVDVVAPGARKSAAGAVAAGHVAPTGAGQSHVASQAATAAPLTGSDSIKLIRQPLTPQQRAENEYRKAMQAQQAGRTQEAMTYLEQALQFDRLHSAARQAMVAWLLEQEQRPQAILKLQEGLGHDPAQSGMAMILARLQVDQGEVKAALDTLNRSLPYTLGRADYQAFMAALLQREARHKEAILRYQNALAIDPDKAVWWMGIGISLQAEQQKAAAREAFSRARGIGGLSPELQAFVEQRISQLQ